MKIQSIINNNKMNNKTENEICECGHKEFMHYRNREGKKINGKLVILKKHFGKELI